MPNSYVNLIYHLIFSTKERKPFIKEPFRGRLHDYLQGAIRGEGGRSIEVGGSDDHVQVLTHLRADRALSKVLQRVKSSTTGWVHSHFPELHSFAWQGG